MTEPGEWVRPLLRAIPLVLVHVGAWLVLKRVWSPSRRLRAGYLAGAVLAFLGLGLPVLVTGTRHGQVPLVGQPLRWFASFWVMSVGALLLGGAAFLATRALLGRMRRRRATGDAPIDPSRRAALTRVGQAVPFAAMVTGGGGLVEGGRAPVLKELEIRIPELPAALDGFRIGQTTDVHVGPFVSAADLEHAIARLDEAGVDLQVMTGDLIDDLAQLDETIGALASVRATHGLVAILGNHEYWVGPKRIRRAYDAAIAGGAPLRLLVDEAHELEHRGARLRVVGVDYPLRDRGPRRAVMRATADRAFGPAAPGVPTVCLSHHPDFFEFSAARGAALTLSGHTHGGQISLLGWRPLGAAFDYPLGSYRRGDAHLYVSAGTGHWMPYRVGTPTEITVLVLRPA